MELRINFTFIFKVEIILNLGNLVKLYFILALQENETSQADKYAELAMAADRYNPAGVEKSQLFLTFRYL